MNQEAQEYLDGILAKDPSWLTDEEIGFLNARRDYLTDEHKRIFADVLKNTQKVKENKSK